MNTYNGFYKFRPKYTGIENIRENQVFKYENTFSKFENNNLTDYVRLIDHNGNHFDVLSSIFQQDFIKSGVKEENWIRSELKKEEKFINNNSDKINPSYYDWFTDTFNIPLYKITNYMNFNLGNVLKYVIRSGRKSEQGYSDNEKGIEDLKKAIWYLEEEIKFRKNEE